MPDILLVEDNEMNREMLTRRLVRRGFSVRVAVDGTSGLRMAREQFPALVIMDVTLPDVDGLDLTRQLKADDLTRNIPIIVLTACAMVGDRERAMAAGADDYDVKPVEIDRLVAKMRDQLARRAS